MQSPPIEDFLATVLQPFYPY